MRNPFVVATAALLVVLAACSSAATSAPAGGASSAPSAADLSGKTVTVGGAFVDTEAAAFADAVKPFEDATGVKVVYNGDKSFEQQLNVQVQAGNPPDVAMLPQPGGMKNYAAQGKLFPLPADIVASIDANYGPGWKDVGTAADGKVYGVFHRVNLKGLVFYPKVAWDAKGYTVPTSWDELKTLEDKMVADGTPPWCIGIESGAADRLAGHRLGRGDHAPHRRRRRYDKWVAGTTPFTDPTVKNAFQIMMDIFGNPKYVYGDPRYIVQTNFGEAPKAAFDNPPKCWMTNQGNFITAFFPDAVQKDLDNPGRVFTLPRSTLRLARPPRSVATRPSRSPIGPRSGRS